MPIEICGHVDRCVEVRAEASRFSDLVERGLALVVRGRALDALWQGPGSATPKTWAEESYDALLDRWEADARKALTDRLKDDL